MQCSAMCERKRGSVNRLPFKIYIFGEIKLKAMECAVSIGVSRPAVAARCARSIGQSKYFLDPFPGNITRNPVD